MPKLCPACKDYPLQNPAFILEAWQPSKMSEELDDHDVNGQEKVWNKGLSWLINRLAPGSVHTIVKLTGLASHGARMTLIYWLAGGLPDQLTNTKCQVLYIFWSMAVEMGKTYQWSNPLPGCDKRCPCYCSRPQVAKSIVFNSQNSADYAAKWVGRPVFVVLMSSLKNKNG